MDPLSVTASVASVVAYSEKLFRGTRALALPRDRVLYDDGDVEFAIAISRIQEILKRIRDKSKHRADLIKILRLLLQLKSLREELAILDQYNQPQLQNFLEAHLIECVTSVVQLQKRLRKITIIAQRIIVDPLDETSEKVLGRLSRIRDFLVLAVNGDSR